MNLDEIQDCLASGISVDELVKARSLPTSQPNADDFDPTGSIQDTLYYLKPQEMYKWNDQGISQLFADVYKDQLRYNATAKEWYRYDGKIWVADTGGMYAAKLAKVIADALLVYCTTIADEQKRSGYAKFVSKYGQYPARRTMVEDARSENYITQADLDQNGSLFNCLNGVLNLDTLELLPHKPKYLLSKLSNVVYDPNAHSDRFEQFIDEIMQGNREKITYLQKTLGYALTVDTSLETCWLWYGATTRNGKSVLAETIMYMLGGSAGYALSMPPETLAQRKTKDTRQASGDIARLDGCRFLNASEPPKRMLFDSALLKTLLGRDTITARHLYEREFEFIPRFKLFVNTNFLPLISDDTLFSSGRINVITFDRHFEPWEQDQRLKDTLKTPENISGIFNWCLEGLRRYRQEGLRPPAAVVAATAQYRKNSDKIQNFIDDCLEPSDSNSGAGTVYKRFVVWCAECGLGAESKRNFFEELKAKGIFKDRGMVHGVQTRNIIEGYELIDIDPIPPDLPF